jgi:anti-anti-sigma regulatory factor
VQIKTTLRTDGRVPVTVFHIQGNIDTLSFSELEKKGEEAYKNGVRRILLDLTEVRFVSSAGVRAIHAIFNLLRRDFPAEDDASLAKKMATRDFKSQLLKLVGPNDSVRQILHTSGYDLFLETHDDLDQAIQSF